jgi:hypothetical protein
MGGRGHYSRATRLTRPGPVDLLHLKDRHWLESGGGIIGDL